MIPLSGGFPNPQMFPFKQLTLEVTGGDPIVLEGKGLQVNHVYFSPQPNSLLRRLFNTFPRLAILNYYNNYANYNKRPTHHTR